MKTAIRDGLVSVKRRFRKKWKNKDKAVFLTRLGRLLQQGYSLSDGISFLKYHQKSDIRKQLDELSFHLRQGEFLHERLEKAGFPKDVLGYLYFSERHGDLAYALGESGKMLARREELKARFRKLVRYPIFLLWIVTVLIFFMVRYLFPQFRSLYHSMDVDFPWFTDLFLRFVSSAPLYCAALVGLLLAAFLYYFMFFRKLQPRAQLACLRWIPFLRSFLPILITQYFSVQLSYLLKGGLSIFEALTVFEGQHHLKFLQNEAKLMKEALKNGERYDEVLQRNPFFVSELSEVVIHGQTGGTLADDLLHYGNMLMEMIENQVNRALAFIQPALFAGVGIVVLTMFLSILLPIFRLLDSM